MKSNKKHTRASQKIPAPFMPPVKRSQIVAQEVERMLQDHIMNLGLFLESLGVTTDNQKEYHITTRSTSTGGPIEYTVFKANDLNTPLGSKII